MQIKLLSLIVALGLCMPVLSEQQCNTSVKLSKPDAIYNDNHDGTVTDTQSRLMWQKCSVGQVWHEGEGEDASDDSCSTASTLPYKRAMQSSEAANAVKSYGYSDWRLPSLSELQTLAEQACFGPSINVKLFPDTVSGFYWSSSIDEDNGDNAWHLSFVLGFEVSSAKEFYYYARLVRDE
ncbi:MAG: DUF1566 domain-containing protein [Sinobacterium sp.]|nr:DUF1566 domain-containing protein [Sinobacterium sp.]